MNVDVNNAIKGYEANNDCIERSAIWYLGMVWYGRLDRQVDWKDWGDCIL